MPVSSDGGAGSDPGSGGDATANPIQVDPGKGWLVTLPMPREVVGKLGGPAQLGERLRPLLATRPGHHGELTTDARDTLAAAYDELFQQLKATPARRREGAGSDDPGNPLSVDPHGGRAVTLPVPGPVLAALGGENRLGERLRPILAALAGPDTELTPGASDNLASAYGELFRHLEAVTSQEGPR